MKLNLGHKGRTKDKALFACLTEASQIITESSKTHREIKRIYKVPWEAQTNDLTRAKGETAVFIYRGLAETDSEWDTGESNY